MAGQPVEQVPVGGLLGEAGVEPFEALPVELGLGELRADQGAAVGDGALAGPETFWLEVRSSIVRGVGQGGFLFLVVVI